MITKFSVHRITGDGAPEHLKRHLADLRSWRCYYIETASDLTAEQSARLAAAIGDPVVDTVTTGELLGPGQVQVAYKRGIVDNENDSILALAGALGVDAVASRVVTAYASGSAALAQVIGSEACNHTIEELQTAEPHYDTLAPQATYAPSEHFDLRNLADDELIALGMGSGRVLDLHKMQTAREIQIAMGAETVSDVFLEAVDAMWSDHCAHTTWKSLGNLLRKLIDAAKATDNPNIISMFKDNAGVWDFYDGYGIAVKAETHNGPTAVSAYFGQLTKIGGVLRDILGTGEGADPIGVFEYTATGLPGSPSPTEGWPDSRRIANETIRAVKEYGNTFGVPMMQSHMTFHPAYRAKPFALGGSIGLIPLDRAEKGKAQPGDMVVLIGGLTGNDGIHGASGSSAGNVMDSTSVQIGSPLEEIKFREAILELRDADCLRAVADMGAAGINSAVGEMGEHTGVWLNTALVPLKTKSLAMWRILLSESQERMALAIAPDKMTQAREILDRHQVRNTVIGRFNDSGRYAVVHDTGIDESSVMAMDVANPPKAAETGFDVPYDLLSYKPPMRDVKPSRQPFIMESRWPSMTAEELAVAMPGVLGDGEVCDQSHAAIQYDSSVQARSFYGPDSTGRIRVATGYHACRPVYGSNAAAVFTTAFNPWLAEAHPVRAARQMFMSALLGQVLAGVQIQDVCMCDNFYTPHLTDDADGWLVGMVNELASLSQQFRTPFISGKDSSSGSVKTDEGMVHVPPAVYISALGKAPDAGLLRTENLSGEQNLLVRIGLTDSSLAGTVAARVLGLEANDVEDVSCQAAYTFLHVLAGLPANALVSGRVIGAGGTLAAAVKSALASDARVELDATETAAQDMLAEHRCAALVEVSPAQLASLPGELAPVVVGRVAGRGEPSVRVNGVEMLTPDALKAWSTSFEEALA